MSTFILVHGGGHTGRCWERIVVRLLKEGHRVFAPDLPGMGSDLTPARDVSLSLVGEYVAEFAQREAERAVMVGHSLGGIAITEAAERAPEAICGLVYVAAVLLGNGEGWMERLLIDGNLPARLTLSEDGATLSVDRESARNLFYSGCSEDDVRFGLGCLVPQPTRPMRERISVTAERFGSVPRAYVETLYDDAFPIEIQRAHQEVLPCDPVFTMQTGHSPFLQAPDLLTEYLISAAEAFRRRAPSSPA